MAWIQCYSEVAAQPRLKWTRLKWMFAPPPICVLALQPTNKTLVVPCRERHAVKMGWGIATSCLICVFGLALWLAVWGAAPLNSRPLPMRDALGPGPGFFPVWLSIIGLSLGALLGLQISRQPAEADTRSLIPERAACARIAAILALLAVAALALDPLGFRVASFVFSLLALIALGIRSPVRILTFALAASIGIFHMFYYWLKVPLPIGPFDYILKPLGL